MKKIILLITIAIISLNANSQTIPSAKVKNLRGETINSNTFNNDGKPMIISFWATWCKPCIMELMTIADEYEDWQEETGVKLIAMSVDDARTMNKVAPFVNGKDWPYEVYIDANADFKRAMNVNNVPHTFLIDGKGKIVWQHNSYAPGDEEELYENVLKLTKGETLD